MLVLYLILLSHELLLVAGIGGGGRTHGQLPGTKASVTKKWSNLDEDYARFFDVVSMP